MRPRSCPGVWYERAAVLRFPHQRLAPSASVAERGGVGAGACWSIRYVIAAMALVGWLFTAPPVARGDFNDHDFDPELLPAVPEGFEVSMWAREPLVRQPCSMAFDASGRLFIGMGPQYRSPTPETPGDSVVLVTDSDGDGVADTTRVFATGFNAIQGLAWHGKELWVANAPDLTVVRDVDGDDEADEYTRLYTDLGNLEHGLHGLNWAPDGKLYMSKGNSKGLTEPGRVAPKAFRDLWGVVAPEGTPDFPPPVTFRKGEYRHNYHDPSDDWGLCGGVLRCDADGSNLEIVSRGMRNPWDMTCDSGFNWLATDNDQNEGDRVVMPYQGAHFGWNHAWSSHWTTADHRPTAPVSGPMYEGSGTGLIYYDAPQFPPAYRRIFFINDWLQKATFAWTPRWDGSLLRPEGGDWKPFVQGGRSLYRPTDIEVGPDGALWVLGWSSGYGAEYNNDQMTNEGRVYRIVWKGQPLLDQHAARRAKPMAQWSLDELVADLDGPLPVWRSDAQEELVRRGAEVKAALVAMLLGGRLSEAQETWSIWAVGRMDANDASIEELLVKIASGAWGRTLNARVQAVRILAARARAAGRALPAEVVDQLGSPEARLRFEAIQALVESRAVAQLPALVATLDAPTDANTFYASWQALRALADRGQLLTMLADARAGVRRAAVLALLETQAVSAEQLEPLRDDADSETQSLVRDWLGKLASGGEVAMIRGPALQAAAVSETDGTAAAARAHAISALVDVRSSGEGRYHAIASGLVPGARVYSDREYTLKSVPEDLQGADLLQTPNADAGSRETLRVAARLLVPAEIFVAVDRRLPMPPRWVLEQYEPTDHSLETSDASFAVYRRLAQPGEIVWSGNTQDGSSDRRSHWFAACRIAALPPQPQAVTLDDALAAVKDGDATRGEFLFGHPAAAGCFKCHQLEARQNGFGPNLNDIGHRAALKHIVQSIVDPSAVITEGFQRHVVSTDDGKSYAGVLLEESGLSVALGLPTGERVTIPKASIEERSSDRVSAMPAMASLLTAQDVADLASFLLTRRGGQPAAEDGAAKQNADAPAWSFELAADRVVVVRDGQRVGDFVFRDDKILRPYFANGFAPGGVRVTRNQPPIEGVDAMDHDTMHPGVWLGFGDVSGVDFWRNQGRIVHERFVDAPAIQGEAQAGKDKVFESRGVGFTTESTLRDEKDRTLGLVITRIRVQATGGQTLLIWDSTFRATEDSLRFGDQEEMGFGGRVATPLTEKNGGQLRSSTGAVSAKSTWGQEADWCDYSGTVAGQPCGLTLMAGARNVRRSWWHNRDYGVFVANAFGRAAMKQGEPALTVVPRGESMRLTYGAVFHAGADYDPAAAYRAFLDATSDR